MATSVDKLFLGFVKDEAKVEFTALNRANVRAYGPKNSELPKCPLVKNQLLASALDATGVLPGSMTTDEHFCGIVTLKGVDPVREVDFCTCKMAAKRLSKVIVILGTRDGRETVVGKQAEQTLRSAYAKTPRSQSDPSFEVVYAWAKGVYDNLALKAARATPKKCSESNL